MYAPPQLKPKPKAAAPPVKANSARSSPQPREVVQRDVKPAPLPDFEFRRLALFPASNGQPEVTPEVGARIQSLRGGGHNELGAAPKILQPKLIPDQPDEEESIILPWLLNDSESTIYYKPEDKGRAVPLRAGGRLGISTRFDGIATHKYKDKVCKLPDFSRTRIDKKGNVWTTLWGWIMGAEWKDKSWQKELWKNDDHGWDELFDAAEWNQ